MVKTHVVQKLSFQLKQLIYLIFLFEIIFSFQKTELRPTIATNFMDFV